MGEPQPADGTRLVATEWAGRLWVSTDSGLTWTAREATRNWHYVASSADGRRLVAGAYNERVYRSSDGGLNGTPIGGSALWWGVATSADGAVVFAAPDGGPVHNGGVAQQSTVGNAGSVAAERYESIGLQYSGRGVFTTLDSAGDLVAR